MPDILGGKPIAKSGEKTQRSAERRGDREREKNRMETKDGEIIKHVATAKAKMDRQSEWHLTSAVQQNVI